MIYTNKSGLEFSKISLGTAEFGSIISKETSFRLLDKFYELGGNLIDTARIYAMWIKGGENASETTIGEWVKSRKARSLIRIATKGGYHKVGSKYSGGLEKEIITRELEESLRCLQTDYVDIYYLHRDDESKPVSEIMTMLNNLIKEGKVRYLGASNWTAKRIAEANIFAKANGMVGFSFSEIMWSYAELNAEGESDKSLVIMNPDEYEWYKNNDIKVMCFSSQAQGFYTKALEKGIDNLPKGLIDKYKNPTNIKRLEELKNLAQKTGISPTAIGLAKLVYNKDIDAIPIIGAKTIENLNDSMKFLTISKDIFN